MNWNRLFFVYIALLFMGSALSFLLGINAAALFASAFFIAVAAAFDINMVDKYFETRFDGGIISAMFYAVIVIELWMIGILMIGFDVLFGVQVDGSVVLLSFLMGVLAAFAIGLYYMALHELNDASIAESIYMVSMFFVPMIMWGIGFSLDLSDPINVVALVISAFVVVLNIVYACSHAMKGRRSLWYAMLYALAGMVTLSLSVVIADVIMPSLSFSGDISSIVYFSILIVLSALGSMTFGLSLWTLRARLFDGKVLSIRDIIGKCYIETVWAELNETLSKIASFLALASVSIHAQYAIVISYLLLPGLINIVGAVMERKSPVPRSLHQMICALLLLLGIVGLFIGPGALV